MIPATEPAREAPHGPVSADLASRLYFQRHHEWDIELFFKWIKQHLRIKRFYGTSENAVKTQIWIAMSVYVLVAIVRKRLGLEASLYTLLQVLSVTIFEKMPLQTAFLAEAYRSDEAMDDNQLNLFSF
jgi:DDE family transposase